MPEKHPTTLNCPACGAPLEFDGTSAVIRCKFCHNVTLMSDFLPAQAPASRGTSLEELRRLAAGGNLLEAVKQYRQIYGAGLKEAKDAIEALQAGWLVSPTGIAEQARPPEDWGKLLEEVQRLLAAGNKIEAIKVYRENYDISLARARYAVERIQAGQTTWPEAGFPAPAAQTPWPEAGTWAPPAAGREAQAARKTNWLGWALPLVILLFTGGIILFGLSLPGGPFNPRYYANGPAVLLPTGTGTAQDVAAVFYDPNAETRFIGLVEADNGKLRWKAAPLAGDGYTEDMSQGADLVYVANVTDLLAYRKSDGSLAWQAQMPDKLNYGENSLLVEAGRVLTLTVDQSMQAYDAGTGALVWSRRLTGYDRALRLMGGSLVFLDYTGDDYNYSMFFLDPASGDQQLAIAPVCAYAEYSSATLDLDSGLVYDEDPEAIYLVYDSSPGCLQRLDRTGRVVWQTFMEDSLGFSPSGFQSLMTDSTLYFSSGNELLAVNKSTGGMQTLVTDEDYEFLPMAITGDQLIVRARRRRGSERFELWGLNAASGERLWQIDMKDAKPIDPPNELVGLVDEDESGWTWKLVAGNLVLIRFQANPNQVVLETINPVDGLKLSGQTILLKRVSSDFYTIPVVIGWQDSLVYLNVDSNLYALDVGTGKLKFEY